MVCCPAREANGRHEEPSTEMPRRFTPRCELDAYLDWQRELLEKPAKLGCTIGPSENDGAAMDARHSHLWLGSNEVRGRQSGCDWMEANGDDDWRWQTWSGGRVTRHTQAQAFGLE